MSLVLSSRSLPFSNTPAAPSSSAFFQAWIWLGWTLNSLASSPTVRSPLIAAKATFALNVALCFWRDCFIHCSCFWAVYRSRTLASPPVSEPGSISLRRLGDLRGSQGSARQLDQLVDLANAAGDL